LGVRLCQGAPAGAPVHYCVWLLPITQNMLWEARGAPGEPPCGHNHRLGEVPIEILICGRQTVTRIPECGLSIFRLRHHCSLIHLAPPPLIHRRLSSIHLRHRCLSGRTVWRVLGLTLIICISIGEGGAGLCARAELQVQVRLDQVVSGRAAAALYPLGPVPHLPRRRLALMG
jgi:hypothetical protein